MHKYKATQNTKLVQQYATGFIFTQMTAKAGLKKHGKLAEQALMKEFMQLLDLDVFEPLIYDTLTEEQRKAALRMVNLIKEKRDHTHQKTHISRAIAVQTDLPNNLTLLERRLTRQHVH